MTKRVPPTEAAGCSGDHGAHVEAWAEHAAWIASLPPEAAGDPLGWVAMRQAEHWAKGPGDIGRDSRFHGMTEGGPTSDGATPDAMKAILAGGGRKLSRSAELAFIAMRIYMGPAIPLERPPGTRGPKPKKTQYDLASERRADLYRRLVKLPRQGKTGRQGGKAPWMQEDWYVDELQRIVDDPRIGARNRATALINELAKNGRLQPDVRAVRRHLKKLK